MGVLAASVAVFLCLCACLRLSVCVCVRKGDLSKSKCQESSAGDTAGY